MSHPRGSLSVLLTDSLEKQHILELLVSQERQAVPGSEGGAQRGAQPGYPGHTRAVEHQNK